MIKYSTNWFIYFMQCTFTTICKNFLNSIFIPYSTFNSIIIIDRSMISISISCGMVFRIFRISFCKLINISIWRIKRRFKYKSINNFFPYCKIGRLITSLNTYITFYFSRGIIIWIKTKRIFRRWSRRSADCNRSMRRCRSFMVLAENSAYILL